MDEDFKLKGDEKLFIATLKKSCVECGSPNRKKLENFDLFFPTCEECTKKLNEEIKCH